jgi:hypothetical protein
MTLRQLNRRCGPLSEATTAQIQGLPLEQLEAFADALLDFQGSADLTTWLAAIANHQNRPRSSRNGALSRRWPMAVLQRQRAHGLQPSFHPHLLLEGLPLWQRD